MSKKIIAGLGVVAGLAVALAPVATFATMGTGDTESDQHTDRLNITVLPACTFGSATLPLNPVSGISHTATSNNTVDGGTAGTWTSTTPSDGTGRTPDKDPAEDVNGGTNSNKSIDELTYSMFAGTHRDDLGTTTIKIVCNDNNGYTVKAQLNNLVEWDASGDEAVTSGATITPSGSYSDTNSGYALFSVTGSTGVSIDAAAKAAPTTATAIAHKATPTADGTGDSITVTYGIGIKPEQKAALYKGDVVYTLIHPAE